MYHQPEGAAPVAGEDGTMRLQSTSSRLGRSTTWEVYFSNRALRPSLVTECAACAWHGKDLLGCPVECTLLWHRFVILLPRKPYLQRLACREEGARGVLESRLSVLEDEIQQVQHHVHAHLQEMLQRAGSSSVGQAAVHGLNNLYLVDDL